MGLAASQARLLTITARKADCEYQSMALSHEKIALSRNMERFSDEYQNALKQTKLIYDYYGSGTSQMPLNYNLFMTPSIYNDYSPKLLTNSKNKVVLNSKFAAAAAAAGIPAEGYMGTPSSDIRNKFIQGLVDNDVITSVVGTSIQNSAYVNNVGLGLSLQSFQVTKEVTYDELLNLFKSNSVSTSDYGLVLGGDLKTNSKTSSEYSNETPNSGYPDIYLLGKNADWTYLYTDRSTDKNTANKEHDLSLYDLLADDAHYVYALTEIRGSSKPITTTAYMQQAIVGTEGSVSFLNWLADQFENVLGDTAQNQMAINYAYNQISDLVYPNENIQNVVYNGINSGDEEWQKDNYFFVDYEVNDGPAHEGKFTDIIRECATKVGRNAYDEDTRSDLAKYAPDNIGLVETDCWHDNDDDTITGVAVDLATLAKVFLTAFVEYSEGVENCQYCYANGARSNSVLYGDYKDNFKFTLSRDIETENGSDSLNVQFYDSLFNMICTQGWTQNDKIDDASYMQELLKNGTVFISTISNDNRYYQNSYNTDVYISEVADTEAVAQAEAKYNAEKVKIEAKENEIDLKIKNLDTEISALTTEYDTVKSLVQKTVEKSIKRYDA